MSRYSLIPSRAPDSWAASAVVGKRALVAAVAMVLGAGTLLGLAASTAGTASAQGRPAILIDGNAVVTGFSGTPPPLPFPPSAADQAAIDLNAPSARGLDLQSPGAPPPTQLLTASKPFTPAWAPTGQLCD